MFTGKQLLGCHDRFIKNNCYRKTLPDRMDFYVVAACTNNKVL